MTQTHSPTPWRVSTLWLDEIKDAEGNICAFANLGSFMFENSEFIVTAVNAYEANQALIRQLVEALEEADVFGESPLPRSGREALDAAKKAGF